MRWVLLHKLASVFFIGLLLFLASCGEEEQPQSRSQFRERSGKKLAGPSAEAKEALQKGGAGLVSEVDQSKLLGEIRAPRITESDFIEGDRRRDPFRPFLEVLAPERGLQQVIQREIKLEEYDIEQLKLIAIITKIGDPRAMVVPPNGEGFILRQGDFVGKPDYIDTGAGGERIQVNWKVHRIHGSGEQEQRGIFLVREDPLKTSDELITRFMALHPQE